MKYVCFFPVMLALLFSSQSCNKKHDPQPGPSGSGELDTNYNPVDPATAATIGFFLNDWQPKTFVAPPSAEGAFTDNVAGDTINIDLNNVITKVPQYIFGNNANQWMGQIVDQSSLMGYMKDLNPNVLRFPGGSISDVYFWNAPVNSPPSDAATTLYNNDLTAKSVAAGDYWYGTNPGSWTIKLDNYYSLLQQTNSTGMITVNYGYARYGKGPTPVQTAAHLAADWVRYDNGRTKFWEIGNENNGTWEAGYKINLADNHDSQSQIITGAIYGAQWKIFADSMRKAADDIGVTIKIGAQILGNSGSGNSTDQGWNSNLFTAIGDNADYFIIHNYYSPYHQNSAASVILNSALTETKSIRDHVNSAVSLAGVQMKPLAMTEYNIEAEGSKQKVSAVAGMHAVLCLGEFMNNGFGQSSRWDLANAWDSGNDHGLFNNSAGEVEPGTPAWNPRPAFYYLYFLEKYLGDRLVTTTITPSVSDLRAYSSTFSSGEAATVIVNTSTATHTAQININHFKPGTKFYWYKLTPGADNGEFSGQVSINDTHPTGPGGPVSYSTIKAYTAPITSGSFKVSVAPRSVLYIVVEKGS